VWRTEQVNLIAPPHYVVTATTLERAEGLAIVNTAIERIREAVDNSHGAFKVLQPVSWRTNSLTGSSHCYLA
jgi:translation initiation factor 2 alpha subunit (eIF-2alpha)